MNRPWTADFKANHHNGRGLAITDGRFRIRLSIAFTSGLLLFATTQTRAQLATLTQVQTVGLGDTGYGAYNVFGHSSLGFSDFVPTPFSGSITSDVSAYAVVSPGAVGAAVSGETTADILPGGSEGQTVQGDATASYQDYLTFVSSSLPIGAPLTLTIDIGVHAATNLFSEGVEVSTPPYQSSDASIFSQVTAGIGGDIGETIYATSADDGIFAPAYQSDIGQPFTVTPTGELFTVTIPNGSTDDLVMALDLVGSETAGGLNINSGGPPLVYSAVFSDNWADTLAWGGVVSSTDQYGNPVDIPDITSESGIDYNQSFIPAGDLPGSVPDNSETLALMGLSLAGLFVVSRTFSLLGNREPIHRQLSV
jgi:hypothetical protein